MFNLRQKIAKFFHKEGPSYSNIDCDLSSQKFTLEVFSAIGGMAIQYSTYDTHRDEERYQLYIVSEDEKLGEALERIIVLESMKNRS